MVREVGIIDPLVYSVLTVRNGAIDPLVYIGPFWQIGIIVLLVFLARRIRIVGLLI